MCVGARLRLSSGALPRACSARGPRSLKSRASTPDLVFRSVLRSGGSVALLIMVSVGSFLAINAWAALHKAGGRS